MVWYRCCVGNTEKQEVSELDRKVAGEVKGVVVPEQPRAQPDVAHTDQPASHPEMNTTPAVETEISTTKVASSEPVIKLLSTNDRLISEPAIEFLSTTEQPISEPTPKLAFTLDPINTVNFTHQPDTPTHSHPSLQPGSNQSLNKSEESMEDPFSAASDLLRTWTKHAKEFGALCEDEEFEEMDLLKEEDERGSKEGSHLTRELDADKDENSGDSLDERQV